MITPKVSDKKPIYMQSVSRKSVYSLVQFRETVAIHRVYGKLTNLLKLDCPFTVVTISLIMKQLYPPN